MAARVNLCQVPGQPTPCPRSGCVYCVAGVCDDPRLNKGNSDAECHDWRPRRLLAVLAGLQPQSQGLCVVEARDGDLWVMLPDGAVEVTATAEQALAACRRWFSRHNPTGFGVGRIEWRGYEPPAEGQ